jgi:hypothetical protein
MRLGSARGGIVLWLLLVLPVIFAPLTSWAQASPPAEATTEPSSSGSTLVAGIGAAAGSAVYAPFKALIMCPVGAVASGATYAATGGKTDRASYVLRLGCTGTYFISPAMVQGQEAFRPSNER